MISFTMSSCLFEEQTLQQNFSSDSISDNAISLQDQEACSQPITSQTPITISSLRRIDNFTKLELSGNCDSILGSVIFEINYYSNNGEKIYRDLDLLGTSCTNNTYSKIVIPTNVSGISVKEIEVTSIQRSQDCHLGQTSDPMILNYIISNDSSNNDDNSSSNDSSNDDNTSANNSSSDDYSYDDNASCSGVSNFNITVDNPAPIQPLPFIGPYLFSGQCSQGCEKVTVIATFYNALNGEIKGFTKRQTYVDCNNGNWSTLNGGILHHPGYVNGNALEVVKVELEAAQECANTCNSTTPGFNSVEK